MKKKIVLLIICMGIFLVYFVNGELNNTQTTTVESNILTGNGSGGGNESVVMIEVPDKIYLGNATIGELSSTANVLIKNVGTVKPIMVQAELVDLDDEVYSYLQISNVSNKSSFKPLNEFSATLSLQKTTYMRLDLREFGGDIEGNIIGKKAQIRFIAMQI
ncbi:MAG: hypothetical protein WC781_05340 [Candidatus Pacearchaeota archaeon]|jgi:hypothetical protein